MIVAGFSAYSRVIDWARFAAIAKSVGAYFVVDMAHVAGPGRRGHLSEPDAARRRGHHHHAQDAARPARRPDPGARQRRDHQEAQLAGVPRHAGRPADARHRRQGGGAARRRCSRSSATTSSRCSPTRARWRRAWRSAATRSSPAAPTTTCSCSSLADRNITGKEADAALGRANITVNKNAVPNDPRPPTVTSGLRLGTPASTTRGFRQPEIEQVADWIADVLDAEGAEAAVARVRAAGDRAVPPLPGVRTVTGRSARRRMHCPFCGHEETKVNDSRLAGEGHQIRRRRECLQVRRALHHLRDRGAAHAAGDQGRPARASRSMRPSCAPAWQKALEKRPGGTRADRRGA